MRVGALAAMRLVERGPTPALPRKREREHNSDAALGYAEVTFRSFRIAQASCRLHHRRMEMLMLVLQ